MFKIVYGGSSAPVQIRLQSIATDDDHFRMGLFKVKISSGNAHGGYINRYCYIDRAMGMLSTAHERQNDIRLIYFIVKIIGLRLDLKNQAYKGLLVDALAHRGEERRGTLR